MTSNGGRRSRRNSSESMGTLGGRRWKKKQHKITYQKPFKLRTEQRGRVKEEEFVKKVQEMLHVEEKQRIPIAQGLPWTTDEPEVSLLLTIQNNNNNNCDSTFKRVPTFGEIFEKLQVDNGRDRIQIVVDNIVS